MKVQVREGMETDAEVLASVAARTFGLACPANTPQEDIENYIAAEFTPEKFKQHIIDSSLMLYVADIDGKAIGYCLLGRSDLPLEDAFSPAIELKRFYILPEFHGLGAAQALMQTALKAAAASECTQVWLSVSNQNRRAIAFYNKSGFVKVGEQKFYVSNDIQNDDIMLNHFVDEQ